MPGSPRPTSARLRPARTSASSRSRTPHCSRRPHGVTVAPPNESWRLPNGVLPGAATLSAVMAAPGCHSPDDIADGADRAVAAADHVGDHARPSGLVRGAKPGPGVTVKILAEHQVVLPLRVMPQAVCRPQAWPPPVRADQEDRDEPVLQVPRDDVQRQALARAPGRPHREPVAQQPPVAPAPP